ncbi:MAG: hypothetical protein ABSH07_13035 [Candidatus Dormibacteria bacterium]|jgi:hypothetical protein
MSTERGAWLLCDACNEDSTMCPTGREAIILARADGWVRVRRYVLGSEDHHGIRRTRMVDLCPACKEEP